jgi:hypothetical protein
MAHLEQLRELHAKLGRNNNGCNSFGKFLSGKQRVRLSKREHATSIIASWKMSRLNPSIISQGQSEPRRSNNLTLHHAGAIHHQGTPNPR